MRKITETLVLKKNASENTFKNTENLLQNKGDFYIRILSFQEKDDTEENLEIIQKCCICFDKLSDAVLMDCGHGGFFKEFYQFLSENPGFLN